MVTRRKKDDAARVFNVKGYKVIVQLNGKQTVRVECAINAGFISEDQHNTGVNHLLEHILTDAWEKCGTSCSTFWADKGVDMNASTDETVLRYHTEGTSSNVANMVKYITNIATHPIFKMKVLTNEKEAVIDELSSYGSDPESNIDSVFNHAFYTGGLRFKDDWQLQIRNLKHLDLDAVRKVFRDNYNPKNIIFIVSGKMDVRHTLAIFDHELTLNPYGAPLLLHESCFSNRHDILFTPFDTPTTKIFFAFPNASLKAHDEASVYLNALCGVLNHILFEKLRTEHNLVYGISFSYELNICGTTLSCHVDVREKHVKECMKLIFETLRVYALRPFPAKSVEAAREREKRNFSNNLPYTRDYSLQFIHQIDESQPLILSKKDKLHKVNHITAALLKRVFHTMYQPEKCMCVYQSKNDLNLHWDDFL